ncbi:pyridoxamine 5'-phosphate oxidase family protein [Flagellimonas allohymeniacidonis]|uniref:Pyridoxamine 5'-phosphate oxidase n=1 Tax=Flagellimonas allohymeniacidonis TaxID=2517819 RepID=A0A4V2HSM1_9FLAO|nr:pyridoxamine 5'-phosphate oxidase family protein [Allomuricauda hymeniacidonis]TAI48250.1 pyridoxamine 5'-phosphate oxidase [Allomuricauda hymeniacidonis]
MIQTLLDELTTELRLGTSKKKHPFRYFTLATHGLKNGLGLRTVVLRKVTKDLCLTFYTDNRSTKMKEIKEKPSVSALFYHPKKLWQLTIMGKASVETDPAILKKYWSGVQLNARKDYTASQTPGSPIKDPEEIEYLRGTEHFAIVHIVPEEIDFLKLGRTHHTRAKFIKKGTGWEGNYLVP